MGDTRIAGTFQQLLTVGRYCGCRLLVGLLAYSCKVDKLLYFPLAETIDGLFAIAYDKRTYLLVTAIGESLAYQRSQ